MNSNEITSMVIDFAYNGNFNAPYGVLDSVQTDSKGKKYKSVTFGRARSLDVEVRIYNRNFMLVRASRYPDTKVFKTVDGLMDFLKTL